MQLRDYQRRALATKNEFLKEGKRRPLIVSPTGSGKTCMGATDCIEVVRSGGRVVWLAHRRELIKQAEQTFQRLGQRVGAFGLNASAPVQIESIPALLRRGEVPRATHVVADEAHHLLADDWGRLNEVYSEAVLMGLTATPERGDGRPMGDVFDSIITAAQIRDLIALNREDSRQGLVPCDLDRPIGGPLKSNEIAESPVSAYQRRSRGRRAVCFAPHVPAATEFRDQFRAAGIRAEVLTASTPKDERDSILTRYSLDKLDVICNVAVLTEGWDDPGCFTAIIARKVTHAGLWIQMTGRVLRPCPERNKARALVMDLTGNSYVHGKPTDDRVFALDGVAIRSSENDDCVDEDVCSVCRRLLVDGACPECGSVSKPQQAPEVVNATMELLEWSPEYKLIEARMGDSRVATLARWMREAEDKSYKPSWVTQRFQRTYGFWPSKSIIEKAQAVLKAVR